MVLLSMIGGSEFLLILFVILLPLIALIDIVKSKFEGNNKLIWVIIVIFTNILGTILYFAIGRTQKIKDTN